MKQGEGPDKGRRRLDEARRRTGGEKYGIQILKASCASYAKGLAPHALCYDLQTNMPFHVHP